MKGCSFASKIKNLFCSEPKAKPLSELIKETRNSYTPLLLRPGNDHQKALMIEQFFYSQKELWANGGYVVTNRQDASKVVRVLNELSIAYELFSTADTKEHSVIYTLAQVRNIKRVYVYIDDDREHLIKRTEDFRRFQGKVMDKCRDWVGEPVEANWDFLPLLFVDMDLPSTNGFMTAMSQFRKQIGHCMVASKAWQDVAVGRALGIISEREQEEYKMVKANSVTVYGSGRRNHEEAIGSHFNSLTYQTAALNTQQPEAGTVLKYEICDTKLSPFRNETNLGLSTLYGDQALYIDLSC